MKSSSSVPLVLAFAGVLGAVAAGVPALAISVTVDGQAATFAPPPIEKAGRVFVPLRGVFERLGASVVYAGGVINATGNNSTIVLHIGSTQATVSGQSKTLDVAPFIVGASTYVPLRFVSEALGAGVNYDATHQIVALTTTGGAHPAAAASMPPALKDLEPAASAFVGSQRPTVSSNFVSAVDPNTVKISLDGLDVTSSSTRSSTGFIYAPPSPLQSMAHTVVVTGKMQGGAAFSQSWSFTSGSAAAKNSLALSAPANGATVGGTFTVTGRTLPNALVHIVAGATASVGGFALGAGNYAGDLQADVAGNFTQSVTLNTVSGASIGLTVTSTDPKTKESAEKRLRLKAQ